MTKLTLVLAAILICGLTFGCAAPPPKQPVPTLTPMAKQLYGLSIGVNPPGAGSVGLPSGYYEEGLQITLTATPSWGYQFTSWSGDVSGTSPTITITVNSNKNIIANFVPQSPTLMPTPTVTPTPTPSPTLTVPQYVWMTPVNVIASGYTVWGGTWYTGPASFAIDGNKITAWTLNAMGEITFDLGRETVIGGIEAYWGGHVSNGNTVNLYVDAVQVLANEKFGATDNIRYFTPIRGRFIKYQTVALPHNEYLQIASWSEIAEFRAYLKE